MNVFEINKALDSMTIYVDTREQKTAKAEMRYSQFGVPYVRKKLDFGDYSCKFDLPDGRDFDLSSVVSIERKQNFDELASCYCTGRKRFTAEFERAKQSGAKLYLLVEGETWEKAYSGSYRSRMAPQSLVASITAWLARYNCQILMCKPETTGKLIRDILYREGKERLERGEAVEQRGLDKVLEKGT